MALLTLTLVGVMEYPEERARTKPSAPFSGHCVSACHKTLKVLEERASYSPPELFLTGEPGHTSSRALRNPSGMAFNHPLTADQERDRAQYQQQMFLIQTKTTLFHARLKRRALFEDPVYNLPWEASIDYHGNVGQPPYDERLERLSDEEAAAKLDRLYAEHS